MMRLSHAMALFEQGGISAKLAGGLHDAPNTTVQRVHSDSRSTQEGDLFVALVGEHFDAHDFLAQARAAGAGAALIQQGRSIDGLACIEVADSLQALSALATQWRQQFTLPVLAVTGSNGKTTVTQMLASIARAAYGEAALATQGNLNSAIGLPLMVLRLRPEHRIAVFELGMNHPGEIAHLAGVAQATVVLVNNAQREHQEFMQTIEAVAEENGSALRLLPAEGVAVIPGDDAYAPVWRELAGPRRTVEFGHRDAEVHIRRAVGSSGVWELELAIAGEVQALRVHALGRHNLRNAMAAAATAWAAGLPSAAIAEGLQAFRAVSGRGVVHHLPRGDGSSQTLVDESYNANPDSVRAAIDVLADLPAPRLLLLGELAEVGAQGPQFHSEIGEYAKAKGIQALWGLGAATALSCEAFGREARHFDDWPALEAALPQTASYASVLIKGSRSMRMERATAALLQAAGSHNGRVLA